VKAHLQGFELFIEDLSGRRMLLPCVARPTGRAAEHPRCVWEAPAAAGPRKRRLCQCQRLPRMRPSDLSRAEAAPVQWRGSQALRSI